ncbi:sugar phosphate nucleotidyltransferase [Acetobacterium woodii]|uniref:Nucleotidyltransferase n=1 Tax=Acetobacterium woodii (strain ATCC 29683 / DSM 1030 / JCM 2381 / KCTC 1655 / WB1) TaxID=931626 RepID=H6LDT1_ACEWD|nr:sugar phosphate nucleotidyltransferase [Acetobacterium woodii]AFA49245.1 nucleotidyltransferase [Acetobacterium woodii DSM 1030]
MELNDFLIDESSCLIDAMAQLDRVARKVVFVVVDEKLVASLTDGDIRRWILKKGNIEALVKNIANYHPKFLNEKDKYKARSFMKIHSIEAVPIINEQHKITGIIFAHEEAVNPKRELDLPVVIMAGGLGTRLYPYTKILPKPLIPIGEIPIVEHIINRFVENGCSDFYLILNHKKNMIKAYFNDLDKEYQVTYIDEDTPLGTGGGLSLLKGKIGSTFILSNCDILIDEDYQKILNFHKKQTNFITMICSVKRVRIPYGVVEIGETGEIEEMKEKPELSFFVNTGMYVVDGEVIDAIDNNQVISFPDIIENYRTKGKKIGLFPISENAWLDMGQLDEMEIMRKKIEEDQ